ncbi:Cleavage and polyadenylation specificity factor subunit 1 [Picochlorum sp. SENEW3]|nr:Cleavage and polyadenylation specificity factor subunit 1 [Picochlorum sp. SENEW3]
MDTSKQKNAAILLEVHEPTAVSHSAAAYLTHSPRDEEFANLVIVRHTYIDVYKIRSDEEGKSRLELVRTRNLFGVVESLSVLKRPRSGSLKGGRDALLLTFRDAKLTVLGWNDAVWDLEPSSLHYFESDVSLRTGRVCFPSPPSCATDPEGRCAAVIMFRHQMAILPAIEPLGSDEMGLFGDPDPSSIGERQEQSVPTASVGNSYIDNLGKVGVRDIRDAVFLHGTSEPTLLCLHDGNPSWAGNLREKKDTCCLTALSINISDKRHPKIWEVLEIPSDAYKLSATPDGGALVFTGTSVLYVNQSQKTGVILHTEGVPAPENAPPLAFDPEKENPSDTAKRYAEKYGLELAPTVSSSSFSYCDAQYKDWNIDCSCATIAWLEDAFALISFRHGKIIMLEITKELGGLRKMVMKKVAAGPQPACITHIGSGAVFVGSRGGDSLLLACTRREGDQESVPKMKKQKIDEQVIQEKEDVLEEYLEEDLLSIYAMTDNQQSPSEVDVRVCDSIISLGAMRKIISVPSDGQEEGQQFLACCGTAENGALAIMQYGLAPDKITTVPLPGLKGVWAIESDTQTAVVLLGFENQTTKVLSGSGSLEELSDTDFSKSVGTLMAGTLGEGNQYQIHSNGMRLLKKSRLSQDLKLSDMQLDEFQQGSSIKSADAAENILLLLLTDGSAHVLEVKESRVVYLSAIPSKFHGKAVKITAATLYHDSSGWLSVQMDQPKPGSIYVCAAYSNGDTMLWSCDHLDSGKKEAIWCSNSLSSGVDVVIPTQGEANFVTDDSVVNNRLVDIKLKLFDGFSSPILIALAESGSLFCYSLFCPMPAGPGNIRMKKVKLAVASRSEEKSKEHQSRYIHTFDRIGEYIPFTGFFVAGNMPLWLIASKGNIYAHHGLAPLSSVVLGFTSFNNANCPHGFLAVQGDGSLLIANFPPRQRMDASWPKRKLGIKSVPLDCTYYPEAKLVALIVSLPSPHAPFLPEDGQSEPHAAYSYSLAGIEGAKDNHLDRHEVRIISPSTWTVLWSFPLLPGEKGISIQALHLKDHESGATVPMIAVGTSFAAGEDYPCSGRVILIEVTKQENNAWAGRMTYAREFKGPVTNVTAVEGYLLLSTGNRIETCMLKSKRVEVADANILFTLQRSAFYEGPSLITSLNVVKNFILLGDAQHSVHFLRYKDQGKQINMLSKDFGQACTKACQFLIAASSLHIVMADGEGNMWTFTYSPNDPKSWKGQKLDNWGALHVGKGVSSMLRTSVSHPLLESTRENEGIRLSDQRSKSKQGVLCCTDLGGIHMVVPLTAAEASSFSGLATRSARAISSVIPHGAGLNPSAFRRRYQKSLVSLQGAKPFDPSLSLYSQGIVDGDLFKEYLHANVGTQARVASQAGTNRESIRAICDMLEDIKISK